MTRIAVDKPGAGGNRLAEECGGLLFRLMRSLAVVENGEARCCGVTTSQALALLAARSADCVTMGRVCEALGVSAGTATRVVDNLVRDGLVERADNPDDRRSVCVVPTAKGRKAIAELDDCYNRMWRTISEAIPVGKLPGTLATLELLVGAVEKARAECCEGR